MSKIKTYTIAEASKAMNIKPATLRKAINDGLLKTEKAGRREVITQESLTDFLKKREN